MRAVVCDYCKQVVTNGYYELIIEGPYPTGEFGPHSEKYQICGECHATFRAAPLSKKEK